MTKQQRAANQFKAYDAATIEHLFRGAAAPKDEDFGYHHGWIMIDGENFNREMATGVAYDHTQGGWAFV
jgi:hypothetical protein